MKKILSLFLACILLISMLPHVALASNSITNEAVYRLFGPTRYDTAEKIADLLMETTTIEKFSSVIVANGTNFPDALAGSYLAAVTGAPIILTNNRSINMDWFKNNVADDANVYILGGTSVVSSAIEMKLQSYNVERLAGANRYATNLVILQKAISCGGSSEDILVCTGTNFADSLSASATGKAILLVGKSLNESQKAYLRSSGCKKIYILGGTAAVDSNIEESLKPYGSVERISGNTRYSTSVKIAEAFFPETDSIILAYAKNFPDGLCGGALAFARNIPLILTASGGEANAITYATQADIRAGVVLGGEGLISDNISKQIFNTNNIIEYEKQTNVIPPAVDTPADKPTTTPPEENNNQIQQELFERTISEIYTEYDHLVTEAKMEHNDNLVNLAAAKFEAESEIAALQVAHLSELNSLNNQKNALVREKDQALANALANANGQYNSYYNTLKKQYDNRIANLDNQIAQINSIYSKQISDWTTYINNLPTVADYEYLHDLKLQDIEKWKNDQIQNAKEFYGIS